MTGDNFSASQDEHEDSGGPESVLVNDSCPILIDNVLTYVIWQHNDGTHAGAIGDVVAG